MNCIRARVSLAVLMRFDNESKTVDYPRPSLADIKATLFPEHVLKFISGNGRAEQIAL